MRIISQNSMADLPYEATALEVCNGNLCIIAHTTANRQMLMAQYSTPEKTQKAMDKLHEAYNGTIAFLNIELPEGGEKKIKDALNGGDGQFIFTKDAPDSHTGIQEFDHIVFRFPQEEELEDE